MKNPEASLRPIPPENLRLLGLYSGRRCLVTGHTGFKGSWLCLWLQTLGAEITGYALAPPTEPGLFQLARIGDAAQDLRGDIRDYEKLKSAVVHAQPEVIFHLAAQSLVRFSHAEPKTTFDVNAGGTVNLLEALRDCPSVKVIVVITSDKCYENREWVYSYREIDSLGGHDPYAASKACAEMICSSYAHSFFTSNGVGLASCRAGNVIGGGDWAQDRIIPDAVRAISQGRALGVRNPCSVRPWQHVLEPLSGYLILGARMLENKDGCRGSCQPLAGPWNFGPPTDSCRPVNELMSAFFDAYGSGSWEDISSGQTEAPREAQFLALNWDKACRYLGWHPRWDLRESVKRTSLWYRQQAAGVDAKKLCMDDIKAYMGKE